MLFCFETTISLVVALALAQAHGLFHIFGYHLDV